jgi:hypothetical protein
VKSGNAEGFFSRSLLGATRCRRGGEGLTWHASWGSLKRFHILFLCETNSHFDSALPSEPQTDLRAWLRSKRAWNELWGRPHIEALAQKRDMPFAALAHRKSNPNPKNKKKSLGKNVPIASDARHGHGSSFEADPLPELQTPRAQSAVG